MTAEALLKAVHGENVDRTHTAALLRAFAADESSPEVLASFLTALSIRGENSSALLGFIEVLREHMIAIDVDGSEAIDLCGTGGDGQNTVNLSTASAFVVSAAGVAVAKHGNHGVSSRTGSVDVLTALGIPFKLAPHQVKDMIHRLGLGFIYAPLYHPLFAKIGPVRRQLGFRTAFNFLGPVCNPARVKRQVIGVPSEGALHMIAEVLAELGTERAMVVHTPGPYDEISLTAPAETVLVERGTLTPMRLAPVDFGTRLAPPEALKGTDAAGNASRILEVFQGESSPLRDAICANAACALFVAGRVGDVRDGFAMAQETITQGLALRKLREAQSFIPQEAGHELAV